MNFSSAPIAASKSQTASFKTKLMALGWGIFIVVGGLFFLSRLYAPSYYYLSFSLVFVFVGWVVYAFANHLTKAIQDIIQSVSLGSNNVSEASQKLLAVSSQLASGSESQAAAIQETVSSVDQVEAMTKKNTDNASQSLQVSRHSKHAVQQGLESVTRMLNAIGDIEHSHDEIINQVNDSNKKITEIVSMIAEINTKTKVINDIVFQTKLLSFNASVEAARAGEHGKGFAVVAEEVGNLARVSGEAAKDISSLLTTSIGRVEEIVKNTKKNVETMIGMGKQKIAAGNQTAQDCNATLQEINKLVEQVDSMVHEISNASREQSQGISEITKAMHQLDHVTQQNSTLAQNSKNTAEDLQSQTLQVRNSIQNLSHLIYGSSVSHATPIPASKKTLHTQPIESVSYQKMTTPKEAAAAMRKEPEKAADKTASLISKIEKQQVVKNDKSIQKFGGYGGTSAAAAPLSALPSATDPRFEDL